MTLDSGIHVDHAGTLLDQPIIEPLMIPLEVMMLGVLLHSTTQMPLSKWEDLG